MFRGLDPVPGKYRSDKGGYGSNPANEDHQDAEQILIFSLMEQRNGKKK